MQVAEYLEQHDTNQREVASKLIADYLNDDRGLSKCVVSRVLPFVTNA